MIATGSGMFSTLSRINIRFTRGGRVDHISGFVYRGEENARLMEWEKEQEQDFI